jgi:hypothetical protein
MKRLAARSRPNTDQAEHFGSLWWFDEWANAIGWVDRIIRSTGIGIVVRETIRWNDILVLDCESAAVLMASTLHAGLTGQWVVPLRSLKF